LIQFKKGSGVEIPIILSICIAEDELFPHPVSHWLDPFEFKFQYGKMAAATENLACI